MEWLRLQFTGNMQNYFIELFLITFLSFNILASDYSTTTTTTTGVFGDVVGPSNTTRDVSTGVDQTDGWVCASSEDWWWRCGDNEMVMEQRCACSEGSFLHLRKWNNMGSKTCFEKGRTGGGGMIWYSLFVRYLLPSFPCIYFYPCPLFQLLLCLSLYVTWLVRVCPSCQVLLSSI